MNLIFSKITIINNNNIHPLCKKFFNQEKSRIHPLCKKFFNQEKSRIHPLCKKFYKCVDMVLKGEEGS
jgi:hypothetical protein